MAQDFYSLFSPYGGYQTDEELLYDNPMLMAGLGGAGAYQGMFPFAGEAAVNSRGTTLPQLMGTGNSQFTGTNAGRLTQGTQIVPQTQLSTINQPPAVQSSGSLSNKTTTAKPGTANYGVNRTSPYTMGPFKSLLGTLTKGLVGSFAVAPNEMGDATIDGAFNRRVAAGEDPAEVRASLGLDADYGNAQDFGYAFPDATLDTTTSVMEAPQNALLDLAERENALGPKLTDIFSGRAEALSAPTENPIDATDPGPVAAPGSPQAIFEEAKKLGLDDRDIAGFEKVAARMGTTFDPIYGFSRDPFLEYQQEQEYLSDRPGYGYAGAANDQLSADFDTISQGVFDTPMTGMRPINAETGEPLSQAVIDAAARAGLELPMASVPLPQAPVNSIPMGRDETRARLGGMTLNQYLDAADGAVSGLRTDPQGRMIPSRGREAQDSVFAYDDMTRADAYKGYEGEASAREGRLAARMQQPGESITERDTRIAGERTQSSRNVPTDVRQAMLTPEGRRTAKQINRLARWGGSTQGQEMGGVAGLEKSLQPVDAQKQQYDAMRVYKLGLEIDKMQQEKPSEYQESAAEVDEAIAAGSIKPEDRNKFILRDLGWQAKGGEDSSDLMSIIYGDGSKSGGEPVLVKTQEEYNNLAKGTRYTDEDGNIATKK